MIKESKATEVAAICVASLNRAIISWQRTSKPKIGEIHSKREILNLFGGLFSRFLVLCRNKTKQKHLALKCGSRYRQFYARYPTSEQQTIFKSI
jgi:hypothetical protein